MRAGERKQGLRVIKHRSCPTRSRVTDRTIRREPCRDVVRVRGVVEVSLVTRSTSRWRSSKAPVDVALRALHICVRARKWKTSHRTVIEGRTRPRSGRVTLLACRGKSSGNMVRILRTVEISLVAAYTRRRCALVLSVYMALRTEQRLVSTRQWESGGRMIEIGPHPRSRRVALRTGLWKTGSDVVGILRSPEILQVTTYTVRWRALVLTIRMALAAHQGRVRTGECESRERGMIELGSRPGSCRVTLLACCREPRGDVVRVLCPIEIILMTTDAVRRCALEIPANVARGAVEVRVRPRKCKTS